MFQRRVSSGAYYFINAIICSVMMQVVRNGREATKNVLSSTLRNLLEILTRECSEEKKDYKEVKMQILM